MCGANNPWVETDRNRVLRFRPKTKPTPKVETYFRPETETKTKLLCRFRLENETNMQNADEVSVT